MLKVPARSLRSMTPGNSLYRQTKEIVYRTNFLKSAVFLT